MTEEEVIKLCMFLTGHNVDTVKQLIKDWKENHS